MGCPCYCPAGFNRTGFVVCCYLIELCGLTVGCPRYCPAGFNRTGFVVCCYLIELCGLTVDQALDAFATARPPGVRHEAFRNELHRRYGWGVSTQQQHQQQGQRQEDGIPPPLQQQLQQGQQQQQLQQGQQQQQLQQGRPHEHEVMPQQQGPPLQEELEEERVTPKRGEIRWPLCHNLTPPTDDNSSLGSMDMRELGLSLSLDPGSNMRELGHNRSLDHGSYLRDLGLSRSLDPYLCDEYQGSRLGCSVPDGPASAAAVCAWSSMVAAGPAAATAPATACHSWSYEVHMTGDGLAGSCGASSSSLDAEGAAVCGLAAAREHFHARLQPALSAPSLSGNSPSFSAFMPSAFMQQQQQPALGGMLPNRYACLDPRPSTLYPTSILYPKTLNPISALYPKTLNLPGPLP